MHNKSLLHRRIHKASCTTASKLNIKVCNFIIDNFALYISKRTKLALADGSARYNKDKDWIIVSLIGDFLLSNVEMFSKTFPKLPKAEKQKQYTKLWQTIKDVQMLIENTKTE